MSRGLYARLAADNIKRNRQTYLPYIITCVITTAMLYIIRSLAGNMGLNSMRGGYALRDILSLGSHITRIFAFIFLFYTNSFLMKRRKKEFGLFNILGMEKRHIARVLFIETVYTAMISLSLGIGLGILLDKLMFLSLTKMLGGEVQLGFYLSVESMIFISVFMLITFLLIYFNALRQIHLAKPIELLHGSDYGEKEPKTKWLMAILGAALIGIGYYISIVTTQPLKAITLFFIAVLCVILGTYFLFVAGSIALLKILKKNKRYYYKTSHFTTVSGMIYRMKQNAVGLANICILSTMVLVMISSTSSLVAGIDDVIKNRYPYEFMLHSGDASFPQIMADHLSDNNVDVEREGYYTSLTFEVFEDGSMYYIPEDMTVFYDMDDLCGLMVIPLEDYNRIEGRNYELQEGEVLLYCSDRKTYHDAITVLDRKYSVARNLDSFMNASVGVVKSIYIVVRDKAELQELYELQQEIYGSYASTVRYHYNFDIASGNEEALRDDIIGFLDTDTDVGFSISTKYGAREEAMSLYGGLFFLGAFLGLLFLMQTILIIYYKQISEGYDDKKRFEIMQNVGMSRAEVKKSIHSQIITVFFLPLITAGVHVSFAFPLIRRLLLMFSMTNTGLYALCLLASFAVFTVIYAIIYSLTARTYYKIVSK